MPIVYVRDQRRAPGQPPPVAYRPVKGHAQDTDFRPGRARQQPLHSLLSEPGVSSVPRTSSWAINLLVDLDPPPGQLFEENLGIEGCLGGHNAPRLDVAAGDHLDADA